MSFSTVGTSPSRSPEKWRLYVTASNYGIVACEEGKYPFVSDNKLSTATFPALLPTHYYYSQVMFDIEGHPAMKEVIHFIPLEPATKLLPALYESVKDDPEAHGIKINSAKTEESRSKHRARLENLQWSPSDCMSSQNKSGIRKASLPNPLTNKWASVPGPFMIKWCVSPDSKLGKKTVGTKRKANDALPSGFEVKSDVDFPGVKFLATVPVGTDFSTKLIDGKLNIVVFDKSKQAEAEAAADAADAADEAEDADDAAEDDEE